MRVRIKYVTSEGSAGLTSQTINIDHLPLWFAERPGLLIVDIIPENLEEATICRLARNNALIEKARATLEGHDHG